MVSWIIVYFHGVDTSGEMKTAEEPRRWTAREQTTVAPPSSPLAPLDAALHRHSMCPSRAPLAIAAFCVYVLRHLIKRS
eukprot:6183946-Pleurochrysis_carterae.AAC.1